MTEEEYKEYQGALKRGQGPTAQQKSHRKTHKTQNKPKKVYWNPTNLDKRTYELGKSAHTSLYVEPDIQECQPTSSKVKVEDLISREDEQRLKEEMEEEVKSNVSTRSFWDRPIPKPQYEWPIDP
jgi:hypothetical protein